MCSIRCAAANWTKHGYVVGSLKEPDMERSTAAHRVIGKLIGNTGDPMRLQVALKDSFAARRGEFVRILHQEDRAEEPLPVLGC